ncbi:MAG: 23S rRNA (adenine(2030)-N(6))-methyltransferase RlmJ [Gallionella sp.]|jgi:23S rRNA (adenine2030-N6)-methyltransferase|nr:23S rRNA (adenine(2030)-N(6))-methyltransferase RlmJ [Gallionella sp.]
MLSYRHAFHAGNHADVLKHLVEILLVRYLQQKDKAFWYVDTHAGAGAYSLESGYATQNAEFETGIARLWQQQHLPAALADYVGQIRQLNPDGILRHYPGSPLIAQALLRPQDSMRLFELHPADFELLQRNVTSRTTQVRQSDGFAALKAVLPPLPRRGLILIDPPYEDKQDYLRVVESLGEGLQRFANGVYAIWYPRLQRRESEDLPQQLKQLPVTSWLHVALNVHAPRDDGFGMHGSGIFIINPPWTLRDTLAECLPVLAALLAQDGQSGFVLEHEERHY